MAKGISIITIVCLFLMFGIGVKSYAELRINTTESKEQLMKKHIEKVKIKNPRKYQDMMKRAGGNITNCCSCHIEMKSCKKYIPLNK